MEKRDVQRKLDCAAAHDTGKWLFRLFSNAVSK